MSHHLIIAANSGSLDRTPDAVNWANLANSSSLGIALTAVNANNTISGISTGITLSFSTTLAYTGNKTAGGVAFLEIYKNGTTQGNIMTGNSTVDSTATGLTVSAVAGDQFYFRAYLPEPTTTTLDQTTLNGTITIKNQSMSNTTLDTFTVIMDSTSP